MQQSIKYRVHGINQNTVRYVLMCICFYIRTHLRITPPYTVQHVGIVLTMSV